MPNRSQIKFFITTNPFRQSFGLHIGAEAEDGRMHVATPTVFEASPEGSITPPALTLA